MLKLFRNVSVLLTLALALTSSPVTFAGDTLDRVVDIKVMKVGMSGNQPPHNTNSRSGQLIGYDVDLARALSGAMGVGMEIVTMPFGDLLGALEKGEVDMVVSGVSITAERARHVTFVGPYMMSGKSILTKNSVLANVQSAADFNRGDLKLTALRNSTSAEYIRSVAPEATLIEVDDYDVAVAMLINDEADGMVADMTICVLSVMRYPDIGLTTLNRPLTVEPIGIAVSRDDPEFANLVDNFLEAYAKIGLLAKLRKKWFEDKSWIAALP